MIKKYFIPLIVISIIICLTIKACAGFWDWYNANHPSGSNKYYELMTDLAPKENTYMKLGPYDVNSYEELTQGTLGAFRIWYPTELENSQIKYPIIISNNGTGWPATKYQEWFKHMASWGFIVIGNDEGTSWNGNSCQATLDWVLNLNESPNSIFYQHLDTNNIGTIGHSQGGTGVENAITIQPLAKMFKSAVMLASTYNGKNDFLQWNADASKIEIPIMILVANDDWLTPINDYNSLWEALPNNIIKIAARRTNCGHGDMLVFGDGYVTAWFLWQLKGDKDAFLTIMELKSNPKYIEIRTNGI